MQLYGTQTVARPLIETNTPLQITKPGLFTELDTPWSLQSHSSCGLLSNRCRTLQRRKRLLSHMPSLGRWTATGCSAQNAARPRG